MSNRAHIAARTIAPSTMAKSYWVQCRAMRVRSRQEMHQTRIPLVRSPKASDPDVKTISQRVQARALDLEAFDGTCSTDEPTSRKDELYPGPPRPDEELFNHSDQFAHDPQNWTEQVKATRRYFRAPRPQRRRRGRSAGDPFEKLGNPGFRTVVQKCSRKPYGMRRGYNE